MFYYFIPLLVAIIGLILVFVRIRTQILKTPIRIFLIYFLSIALALLVPIYYFNSPIPTQIRLELTIQGFSFELLDNKPVELESILLSSIGIFGFSEIKWNLKEIVQESKPIPLSDPLLSDIAKLGNHLLKIKTTNENTKSVSNAVSLGTLENIKLHKGDKVTFKVGRGRDAPNRLIIEIEKKNTESDISLVLIISSQEFLIETTRHPVPLKGTLEESDRRIDIIPSQSLELDIDFFSDKTILPLVNDEFSINLLDLTVEKHQYTTQRKREYALVAGDISYPEYPEKGKLLIKDSDILKFDNKNQLMIVEKLLINPDQDPISLKLRLQGKFEESIYTHPVGSEDAKTEYRLVRYEVQPWNFFISGIIPIIAIIIALISLIVNILPIWNPLRETKSDEQIGK